MSAAAPGPPVVLVTGAGRGLGRAIAEEFHANGYRVVAADLDFAQLADVAEADRWTAVAADVTEPADVERLAGRVDAELGRLDVVVNNAGIIG